MKLRYLLLTLPALLLAACSSAPQILDTIPATDDIAVVAVDPTKTCDALDITRQGDAYTFPAYVGKLTGIPDTQLATIGTLLARVEGNIYAAATRNGAYVTAMLKDPDADKAYLEELCGAPVQQEGFDIYQGNIYRRDAQIWLAYDMSATALADMLKQAEQNPLSKNEGAVKVLTRGDMLNAIAASSSMPTDADHGGSAMLEYNMKMVGNRLQMSGAARYPDGTSVAKGQTQRISLPLLNYLPQNAIFAAAIGAGKYDWDKALGQASGMVPPQQAAMLSMITQYLKGIDGTIVIGAGLKPDVTIAQAVQNIDSPRVAAMFDFLLMVHMEQKQLKELASLIRQYSAMMGGMVKEVEQDIFFLNDSNMALWAGVSDGCLFISSNKPQAGTPPAGLVTLADGEDAAALLNIPNLAQVNPNLNFGIVLESKADDESGTAELYLTDNDGKLLPTLLTALANIK